MQIRTFEMIPKSCILLEKHMKCLLALIRLSLWGNEDTPLLASREEYDELIKQAILLLTAPVLDKITMPQELLADWRKLIIQQISYNTRIDYAQDQLPITVPYVILKGTAAAQYYPQPEYRTMGDVDIMTRREDLDKAYQQLLDMMKHATNKKGTDKD